jgi:uncharacterized protein
VIRIAAAGDVHASEATRERVEHAFADVESHADVVLLAGDLTTMGQPEQAAVLAEAARGVSLPVFAVLGNHDYHCGRADEIRAVLEDAEVHVLDRSWAECEINGLRLGIVGAKGFIGGFPGSSLPDFGEPSLRHLYAETSAEVDAIDRGLHEIARAAIRIVLLHYAPTMQTLEGEPASIWAFLGSDRMGVPIAEHRPDLVVHGHGHAGRFEGVIGDVPVYNVAIHVTGRTFTRFHLAAGHAPPVVADESEGGQRQQAH